MIGFTVTRAMQGRAVVMLMIITLVIPLTVWAQSDRPPYSAVRIAQSYEVKSDITYHVGNNWDAKLDLYIPKESEIPPPVLIYYHGGGWIIGDRHSEVLRLLPYIEKGFAVANVSYRLAKVAPAPAAVVDAVCAFRWVVRNAKKYGIDENRIVLSGHSAGGHLALIVGTLPQDSPFAVECASVSELFRNTLAPTRPVAVVNWFGVTDVADLLAKPNRRIYAEQWIAGQAAGHEIARAVSPITYVRADLPPILSIHGDRDPHVPYEHAVRMHEALETAGASHKLILKQASLKLQSMFARGETGFIFRYVIEDVRVARGWRIVFHP